MGRPRSATLSFWAGDRLHEPEPRRVPPRALAYASRGPWWTSVGRSGFHSAKRDLIPRETSQGFCRFWALLAAVRRGFAAGGAAFRRSPACDQTRLSRSRRERQASRANRERKCLRRIGGLSARGRARLDGRNPCTTRSAGFGQRQHSRASTAGRAGT
jgi:hypothetical protein